jgi:hypothetical protein
LALTCLNIYGKSIGCLKEEKAENLASHENFEIPAPPKTKKLPKLIQFSSNNHYHYKKFIQRKPPNFSPVLIETKTLKN